MENDEQLPPGIKAVGPDNKHVLAGWRFYALIFTIILTVIGYLLFSLWGGWHQVVAAFYKVGAVRTIAILSVAFISYLFRFSRWNYFLHTLGHRVPIFQSLRLYLAGFSLTTTPGKAGEALRSVFLKDYGIAYRRSFGALLSERFSDLIAVVVLAAGGLFVEEKTRIIILLSLLFIAFALYAIQNDPWLKAIERWTSRKFSPHLSHVVEFMIETVLAFRSCFKTRVLIWGIILGCIAWGLEGAILYFLLKTLGSPIALFEAIYIHAFALLVGAITFLPGGLGGAEVTLYELLRYHDVPSSTAVAATLFLRLSTLWFSVVVGLIALPKRQIAIR